MKDGYTNNTFITLCCDEEFLGVTDEATYVNDRVLSIKLLYSTNGDVDVPIGLPYHEIFAWPYEGVISSYVDVIQSTF